MLFRLFLDLVPLSRGMPVLCWTPGNPAIAKVQLSPSGYFSSPQKQNPGEVLAVVLVSFSFLLQPTEKLCEFTDDCYSVLLW